MRLPLGLGEEARVRSAPLEADLEIRPRLAGGEQGEQYAHPGEKLL